MYWLTTVHYCSRIVLVYSESNLRLIFVSRCVECFTKCLLHQDMRDVFVTCGDGKKNSSLYEMKYGRSTSRDNKTTRAPLRHRLAKRPKKYKNNFFFFTSIVATEMLSCFGLRDTTANWHIEHIDLCVRLFRR